MNLDWKLHYLRVVIDDGEPEGRVGDVFDWFAISLWPDAALPLEMDYFPVCVAAA
jgi:hypothetical protein